MPPEQHFQIHFGASSFEASSRNPCGGLSLLDHLLLVIAQDTGKKAEDFSHGGTVDCTFGRIQSALWLTRANNY
jgi:hypothetical protein